ncbi:ATP-dependent DNA helicase PIF1 [Hirsutella rhossiliensis]
MEGDPRFQQQFARDFRVRRSCLLTWLHYLRRHHPGYRDIVVPQGPVEEASEEDPFDADASAIPDLQVTDTELNALQSRFLNLAPDSEHMAFVALNTLLQEAMAKPDEPEAQALIQSITRQAAVIRGTRPYCAADYHWESLYRHMPRFNEWQAAPEAARMALSRQLLRDNAHIAAYHFHKRYTLFRTIVLKQKFNLTDFWGRYEWQGRGSSHHHGLYWLNGHPDLDPDDDQSRERFARIWGYHVSAVNPEPQRIQAPGKGILIINLLQQPLTVQFLSMVVNRVQRHRCNNYSPTSLLDKAPHSKHWSFRGERNDGQINHYNRLLTVSWLANTDVSPCTSLQQVIDYAAKYCSKSEKKSESFAHIGKALMPRVKDHNPLVSFTSKLLNQLVAERDYSKQEVSHLLLGLPLQEGSRTCLLIQKDNSGQITAVLSPIVGSTTVMVMTITAGQKRLDYSLKRINTRLCLWRKNLMTKTGFASPLFYLTTPLPRKVSTYLAAAISTSITTGHGIHPMANDVEVLGPHWRDRLNPQQRLVYDTFMGHFQAQNPAQILLHVDGGGGTGKSFLIKSRLRHVKYLVIDEKSMLGLEQLARIDSRLRQAFPQRNLEFFGGRQAGDDQAQFRQALQELREVKLSIPSWNLLSNRVQAKLTQSEVDSFGAALRVYSTKARVEAKNQGKGAGQAPSDNAGNLSNKFPVAKGARGTIYDIGWNTGAEPLEDPQPLLWKISPILPSLTKDQIVTDLATRDFQAGISYSLYKYTPTEGMKMRLADQQRRQTQQLTNPPYTPLYLD